MEDPSTLSLTVTITPTAQQEPLGQGRCNVLGRHKCAFRDLSFLPLDFLSAIIFIGMVTDVKVGGANSAPTGPQGTHV